MILAKLSAAVAMFALVAAPTHASDHSKVESALRRIPSAAGGSVFDRIHTCGIRIDWSASYVEPVTTAHPTIGALRGDQLVDVIITVPSVPGDSFSLDGLEARWIIRNGRAMPNSNWADQLQNKAFPIGSSAWMDC